MYFNTDIQWIVTAVKKIMKKITNWTVGAFCALLLVTSTFAATNTVATVSLDVPPASEETWTLTLGGVGATATDNNGATAFGADISIGRTGKLLFPLEAGVRQSVSYGDGSTLLNTRLYSDWTVLSVIDKKVDLFVGGNIGIIYGNTTPEWAVAPEGGARWWVKDDVALVGRVEAPFAIGNDLTFQNGVKYFLGLRVDF